MIDRKKEPVSDELLLEAFENSYQGFSDIEKIGELRLALVNCMCGYYVGHTIAMILFDLGFITYANRNATKRGKEYCREFIAEYILNKRE